MKFNKKGQGALEYLLLIGGAVLIAVIVIALLVGMGSSSKQGVQDNVTKTNEMISGTAIAPILNSAICDGDNLVINFTSQGGELSIITDGLKDTNTAGAIKQDTNITMTKACRSKGTTYKVQLRAKVTTSTGESTADSNPIIVTGK